MIDVLVRFCDDGTVEVYSTPKAESVREWAEKHKKTVEVRVRDTTPDDEDVQPVVAEAPQ